MKPEQSYLPMDEPHGRDLLKLILEEVKAARQETGRQDKDKDKGKPGFYKRLAEIIDSVFFVLYVFTIIIFLTYMYIVWVKDYVA